MKRLSVLLVVVLTLAAAAVRSRQQSSPSADPVLRIEERNPWTNLRFNNDPSEFRFAIVSDRTGAHRARIFSQAVEQLNLLQPEFVLSIGDLIEGYTEDQKRLTTEWKEFQGYVNKLQMPFFYVAGNHDVTNLFEEKLWKEKFGRRYYSFLYRNVLFLILCADDPPNKDGHISAEQVAWAKKTLEENPDVRWTIVSLHKPLWAQSNLATNGWLDVEKLLAERPYTVFAGHVHRYQKFVRQKRNYYQLATTGGGSRLRGIPYGEFDHITWVTMKNDGPLLANLMLDGIYTEDMRQPVTDESGFEIADRRPVFPVRGTVLLDGCTVPGALVTFHYTKPEDKKKLRPDAVTESDGTFSMSTFGQFDGAPAGEYVVTVKPFEPPAGPTKAPTIPAVYTEETKSPLKVRIEPNKNELNLELKTDSNKGALPSGK